MARALNCHTSSPIGEEEIEKKKKHLYQCKSLLIEASSRVSICKFFANQWLTFANLRVTGVSSKEACFIWSVNFDITKRRYEKLTDYVGSILAGSLWRGGWTLQRCPLILCPPLSSASLCARPHNYLTPACHPAKNTQMASMNCVSRRFLASKEGCFPLSTHHRALWISQQKQFTPVLSLFTPPCPVPPHRFWPPPRMQLLRPAHPWEEHFPRRAQSTSD